MDGDTDEPTPKGLLPPWNEQTLLWACSGLPVCESRWCSGPTFSESGPAAGAARPSSPNVSTISSRDEGGRSDALPGRPARKLRPVGFRIRSRHLQRADGRQAHSGRQDDLGSSLVTQRRDKLDVGLRWVSSARSAVMVDAMTCDSSPGPTRQMVMSSPAAQRESPIFSDRP